jgi:hypothetical protein
MASITLGIENAVLPYIISVKKVGDNNERYISYIGTTLNFVASTEDATVDYVVSVTDNSGCIDTVGFSLNCSTELPDPSFTPQLTQPICNEDGTYQPATITLNDIQNATRYKVCYNTLSFDCGDCLVSDGLIVSTSQTIVLNTPTVPTSRFFILRVYNGDSCVFYTEVTGTIITESCVPECDLNLAFGQPTC